MKETYEFRIPDEFAVQYLDRDVGELIGVVYYVRKVVTTPSDPLFAVIRDAQREQRARGSSFVSSVTVYRKYTKHELDSAELLTLMVHPMFEPAGEECGTIYDDSQACPRCHAPRRQVSDLSLDLTKFPRGKSAAVTIARSEVVFADGLAQLVRNANLRGIAFRPVRQCPPLRRSLPPYWQPQITSSPVSAAPETKFGYNIFDEDLGDTYRCPVGPVVGLHKLSELYIKRSTWDGSDFAETAEFIGVRQGLLNPFPLIVLSQRARRVLETMARGIKFEVVHLV